jgi:hypothetical protein
LHPQNRDPLPQASPKNRRQALPKKSPQMTPLVHVAEQTGRLAPFKNST